MPLRLIAFRRSSLNPAGAPTMTGTACRQLADVVPDDRVRHVEVEQVRGHGRHVEDDRGVACRVEVEARRRGSTRDRRCDVEEISVAVGAGTEHCAGEDDGVRPAQATCSPIRAGRPSDRAHVQVGSHPIAS